VGLSASGDTYGITATTNGTTGYAVYATTSQGYGIYADSTNATGVWAHGGSFGVDADSANGFGVHGNSDNNTGVGGVGGIYGVWGKSTTASGVGVYGECPANIAVYGVSTNNTGVWGQGGATGVTGVCDSTYGVHGESKNGFGVWGHSDNNTGVGGVGGVYGVWGKNVSTGIGVYGENDSTGSGVTGVSTGGLGGVFTGGRAPLLLTPAGAAGPPTSGSHARGEVYVDSNGLLFSCTASGTPGSWRKLSSTVPIPTVRVLNTRPAKQIGPYKGPIASNTVLTLTLAGTNGIPSNATGVMGNLTAADATGSCFLALVPSGANHLGVSSINFPAQAPGTGLANAFTVGLSSDGKVDIYTGNCGNYTVNIIMDISGFII
jgi:hypothetical protein